jgi:CubicO group peptidase (beta-lactamase class C family)
MLLLALACAPRSEDTSPPEAKAPALAALDPALSSRMEELDRRIAQKREELGIPGLALVVVKDDRVIYRKGHGLRNVADSMPVDEDTLFAIGSTTKAFTAMLVMMAVDEGKLSLDDHPRKCVPYFKLKDEEADEKIQVRDLLTHSSGLMRTDLGWYTGELSTKETIELAGLAESTAKLREKFQYQNVMYAAAGECVAQVYGKPYPDLLQERIFEPLGMTHGTNVSVEKTLTLPARAVGYAKAGPEKTLMPVPMRPIDNVDAAGAINSSIRDMAGWLRLMLGEGEVDGKRLVSERSFKQIVKRHQKIMPTAHYGLGWLRDRWRKHRRLWHTGGIDGFVTLVALLPKEKVGFALFTNIQNADIHGFVTEEVFSALTEEGWGEREDGGEDASKGSVPTVEPEKEAGQYGVVGGLKIDIEWKDGKLVVKAPHQPKYPLVHLEARKYRLGAPAPAGFYVTFRPREDRPDRMEALFEQPQGDMVIRRLRPEDYEEVKKAGIPDELRALMGVYKIVDKDAEIEIGTAEGRVAVLVSGQPPAPLLAKGKDEYALDGLPESFSVRAKRNDKGKVVGLTLVQPNVELDLELQSRSAPPKITVARLMKKVMRAHASKRLAKKKTMIVRSKVDMLNQGLQARRVLHRASPDKMRDESTLTAFGRDLGTAVATYDGTTAGRKTSFTTDLPLSKEMAAAIRLEAAFDPIGSYEELLEEVVVKRSGKVDGEEVIVVEGKIKSGGTVTEYVSKKSSLVLKRDLLLPIGPEGSRIGESRRYKDYRKVSGVMIPHTVETKGIQGKIIETVESVEFDVDIPPETFATK